MPKLPDEDFEEAVHIAEAEVDQHQPGRHGIIKGWGGGDGHRQRIGKARPALPGVEEVRSGEDGWEGVSAIHSPNSHHLALSTNSNSAADFRSSSWRSISTSSASS